MARLGALGIAQQLCGLDLLDTLLGFLVDYLDGVALVYGKINLVAINDTVVGSITERTTVSSPEHALCSCACSIVDSCERALNFVIHVT